MFEGNLSGLNPDSRLLLIAPHPDDEALGCGIILQRAVRAGAAIRVVYATDGDDNPWPQRLIQRKWRLDAEDRKRWGQLRRSEALAALQVLGVPATDVHFMGLPDQGLTSLLTRGCRPTLDRLRRIITEWSPTDLFVPSVADTHPDHNALAVMLHIALNGFVTKPQMRIWSYLIHGRSCTFRKRAVSSGQSKAETVRKINAINCHKTQLRLSRQRFLNYAARPERFTLESAPKEYSTLDGGFRSIFRTTAELNLNLQPGVLSHRKKSPVAFVCGYAGDKSIRSVAVEFSKKIDQAEIRDIDAEKQMGIAAYRDDGFVANLRIPTDLFDPAQPIFIKLARRRLFFFDEAGWQEVPAASPPLASPAACRESSLAWTGETAIPNENGSAAKGRYRISGLTGSPLRWAMAFAAVLVWLGFALSEDINRPWIGTLDYNGAVWSQSAHNILRAGLAETSGASSGFYFGPLPIPAWGYYLHHPPLLHLVITALFWMLGEHEWVARLLPIGCSLVSAFLVWLLVRDCAGYRAATLAAAVFACLPMELRYGKMVNFEPAVLMLILGALLCLRYWHLSRHRRWQYGVLALVLVGLWVDWAMYIFVVSLSACWLGRTRHGRRFAVLLVTIAIASVAVYLIRIRLLRPDAWQNLTHTLIVRLGTSGRDHFTEMQWITRVFDSLMAHFLPLGWVLAATGAVVTFRARRRDPHAYWIFQACLCMFVMDALFVGLFQNDSYIHQYISFYFVAPVAIMAGITLDRLITFFRTSLTISRFAHAGEVVACLLLLVLANRGTFQTTQLQRQFHILDYHTPEPPNLIPELGDAIQKHFPSDAHILCNFLPEYGPQFAYYAQRDILNNLSEYRFWQGYLKNPTKPIGGVVWMTPKTSQELISKLPPGSKQFLNIGELSFCLWKPAQAPPKTAKTL